METTLIKKQAEHLPWHTAINWLTLAQGAALFSLLVAGLAYVQFGTAALAGNDGYYHIKMGWLMRQHGPTPAFPWLPQTILNANAYYDHHFLYHAYLALFAWVDPAVDGGAALTLGAKIASIVLPALAFLAIWWLLRGQRVPYAAVWALGLLTISDAFLYRMSMPRAQSASLLLLVVALHWLLQGRHRLLVPLGFLFVWTYNAFPLLLLLAAVYTAAVWLYDREMAWGALVYPALGLFLGLTINPYFPANITFIINHLLPKLSDAAVSLGNEWEPYRTWTLAENSGVALALCIAGVLALGWHKERMDRTTFMALLLSLAFGAMLFKSRRFVEYFPPFALIFAAVAIRPLLAAWRPRWRWLPPALLALLLLAPAAYTLPRSRDALHQSKPANQYAAASLWLRANAPLGSVIFQTDWDDFTRLFFYNDRVIYTLGLDPTYMQLYDAALYEEWVALTRGEVENPSALIRSRFNGDYVFSDLRHSSFEAAAAADPHLQEVYRDDFAIIWQVIP